ncbi:type VI secretion system Vgr family protein [Oceanicola sp. 502str15]|uniref:type VI secretion system Vgr family protein n=1 Tax=Oceanicola sp. 502str15 TaxID=2696061 RepID=UPI0020964638|nr:type VI secretion system tip protein TssI/VgrG [Oceanicola sp. 502str15]MCO6382858.1 type VI secretion system tip protein VgrG [Oceanicola sp. 502str15]
MHGVFTQDHNLGWLETALGKDHLLLVKFSGTDKVNDLFEYRLRVTARRGLDFDALLGNHATVFLHTVSHGAAPFDGIVTQIQYIREDITGEEFELVLRPWFWLAGKRRQQRIFHDMSVDEILEEVLQQWSHAGPSTHRQALSANYPKLEYTVQYRESDLAFACRLMERFGISYHFEHEGGNHCLVLTDDHEAMGELPGGVREFRAVEEFFRKDEEHFWAWRRAREITTGKIKLTDYNFKIPGSQMITEQLGDAVHDHGEIESYDYPGGYPDTGEGTEVAVLRSAQERSADRRTHALGDVISLKSGMRCVAAGDHSELTMGEQHLCLEAHHDFTAESYRSGSTPAEGEERAYNGAYLLTPVSAPFAPVRKTAQPVVHGPQTARVVGDGEIDCDEYGRILVRFHWDLEDAYSMRCRVSQNWAGKGWGGMVIPRIGMEVVVEFLEGDPDKPLVTGCVYNGRNDVPYELPKHKTRSTFKTDTHEGDGYNELRFEDEKDEEEIFLHAEKDHNTFIKNNESHQIGNNRTKVVGVDQKERVGQDKQIDVGRDHVETIARDERKTVLRNSERQVDKDSFDYVNNHRIEATYANHQEEVGGHHYQKIEGNSEVAVGQKLFQRSSVQVLHAKDKFIIGGPGGTIEINNSGVVIRAPKIELKGPVNVTSGAPDQIRSLESAINEGLDLAQVCIQKLTDE